MNDPVREGPLGPTPADAGDEEAVKRRGIALVAGLAVLLACVASLALVASGVVRQEADTLDTFASPFMHGLASPPLDALMNAASFVGGDRVLVPATILLAGALAVARRWREAAFLVVALAGSTLVNDAMKLYFHRARPALSWASVLPDYSFPSGHSMNSLAFGLALSFVVWRLFGPRRGLPALLLAAAASATVGLSRIYLGYHYATDVIGGFLGAILWVAIVVAVFRPGRRWRARRTEDPRDASAATDGRGPPPGELRGS